MMIPERCQDDWRKAAGYLESAIVVQKGPVVLQRAVAHIEMW